MASRIHFKLKNALEKKSVAFDGAVIQVGDIKRLIAEQLGTSDPLTEVILRSPDLLLTPTRVLVQDLAGTIGRRFISTTRIPGLGMTMTGKLWRGTRWWRWCGGPG